MPMTLLWRVTLRELATKLDEIDVLVHALHVRLEREEERLRDQPAPPPPKRDVE